MISKNTAALINLLARRPAEIYNINQIARQLKISVGSAHKILKELEKRHVVLCRPLGNALYYSINKNSREAQLMIELIKLSKRG